MKPKSLMLTFPAHGVSECVNSTVAIKDCPRTVTEAVNIAAENANKGQPTNGEKFKPNQRAKRCYPVLMWRKMMGNNNRRQLAEAADHLLGQMHDELEREYWRCYRKFQLSVGRSPCYHYEYANVMHEAQTNLAWATAVCGSGINAPNLQAAPDEVTVIVKLGKEISY